MYKNQRILYSENEPENEPENGPENEPENEPETGLGTKNVFLSKILFYNEFPLTKCIRTLKSVFEMILIAKRVNLCL